MCWLQMQSALQSVHSAFVMGPKERAVYLRKPVPKGPHAAEQSGEEEAGTLAGTNAAALRAWLRQVNHNFALRYCQNLPSWQMMQNAIANGHHLHGLVKHCCCCSC